jgi:hypothetical protein
VTQNQSAVPVAHAGAGKKAAHRMDKRTQRLTAASPAMSGLFLRLCPPGQPAIKMNGNHTPFQLRNDPWLDRRGAISHKV